MTAPLGRSQSSGPEYRPNWAGTRDQEHHTGPAPLRHKCLKNLGKFARWFSWAGWVGNRAYPSSGEGYG